jgi:hypothetical protein
MYGRKSPMRDGVVRLYDAKAERLVEAEVAGVGLNLRAAKTAKSKMCASMLTV